MKSIMILATVVFAFGAQAGTVLKFHNGSFDPINKQAQFSNFAGTSDYVVQFDSKVTEAHKELLQKVGAKVYRYVPEDALIISIDSKSLPSLQAIASVRAVIPYKGSVKLSSNLPTLSTFSNHAPAKILITAFEGVNLDAVLAKVRTVSPEVSVLEKSGKHLAIVMNAAAVPSLSQISGVEFIEKMEEIIPFYQALDVVDEKAVEEDVTQPTGDYTDLTGFETGTKLMNFEAAWNAGFKGEGQIVAMADTGLDSGDVGTLSADFAGAVTKGYAVGIGAKSWEDPMGHGTHVAGSVMARGLASKGKIVGGAHEAQLIPQGMWSPIIDNLTVPPKLEKLFASAEADGAKLHTNSWGSPKNLGAYDAMAQQVDEYAWNHQDFLPIFAAGNSGVDWDKNGVIDPGSVSSPGTAKNSLTVGASENTVSVGGIQRPVKDLRGAKDNWGVEPIWSSLVSDNAQGIAMFSSRGPTKDGRLKPEIVAPGTNILSSKSHHPEAELLWGKYNDDYVYSGGTSMATPLAAGAAAVVREVLVKKFKIASPSASLVKATMVHTAFDLFPGQYGEGSATQELKRRPNSDEGYGRVDMAAVVDLNAKSTSLVDEKTGVGAGQEISYQVKVKKGAKLLVNLVYTDAPGTLSAGKALVNNLDLVVEGPKKRSAAQAVVFASQDNTNNNEIAELEGLESGTYTIKVKGTDVPMGKDGKQPYALVYTSL